jgi:hypothetical protein
MIVFSLLRHEMNQSYGPFRKTPSDDSFGVKKMKPDPDGAAITVRSRDLIRGGHYGQRSCEPV